MAITFQYSSDISAEKNKIKLKNNPLNLSIHSLNNSLHDVIHSHNLYSIYQSIIPNIK